MDSYEPGQRHLCSLVDLKAGRPEGGDDGVIDIDLLLPDGQMLLLRVAGLTTGRVLDATLASRDQDIERV